MYSLQFINKILKQRSKLSIQKLAKKYELSTRTIQNWIQGKLPKGKRNRPNIKLDINLLIEDVANYPDAYQYERAKRLRVSEACIWKNLKKLNITYKKNVKTPKGRRREAIIVSEKD
jgi:transposase